MGLPCCMRIVGRALLPGCLAAAALFTEPSLGACAIAKAAELSVVVRGMRAILPVKIDGEEVSLIVDSGAFFSMLSPGGAATLKLPVSNLSPMHFVRGFNGGASVGVTTVQHLVLNGTDLGRFQFLVGGTDLGSDAVGLLGNNILSVLDTEYDLQRGVIRLLKPMDCRGRTLAYWAASAKLPFGVVDTEVLGQGYSSHIIAPAFVNGHRIRVLFDTGSQTSELSSSFAAQLGITARSPGVVAGGLQGGLGRGFRQSWIGPFASFKIDSEEVRNTRLRFSDFDADGFQMILGMDFFLSHHVYVANSQHKLYFTYNGGPVFNLAAAPAGVAAPEPGAAAAPGQTSTERTDISELAAQGRAQVSRHEYAQAVATLTRVVQQDPSNADNFLTRADAYLGIKNPALARSDLDQALKLKPDLVDALLTRARLEMSSKDPASARADVDAADRAEPQASETRLVLARFYETLEAPEQAIRQLDLWIPVHSQDALLPSALNTRCWTRMLANQDLEKAEADCKAALHLAPKAAMFLDSLGWVHFRRGAFDQSIRDFNAVLKQAPMESSSLYGRGMDELRLGKVAAGMADIAAARAQPSGDVAMLEKFGIQP